MEDCDGAQRRLVCLCPRPQISHFQVSIAMGRSAAPLQLRLQPAQHRYRNNPMLTPSTCAPGTIQPNAYQVPVHIEYESKTQCKMLHAFLSPRYLTIPAEQLWLPRVAYTWQDTYSSSDSSTCAWTTMSDSNLCVSRNAISAGHYI